MLQSIKAIPSQLRLDRIQVEYRLKKNDFRAFRKKIGRTAPNSVPLLRRVLKVFGGTDSTPDQIPITTWRTNPVANSQNAMTVFTAPFSNFKADQGAGAQAPASSNSHSTVERQDSSADKPETFGSAGAQPGQTQKENNAPAASQKVSTETPKVAGPAPEITPPSSERKLPCRIKLKVDEGDKKNNAQLNRQLELANNLLSSNNAAETGNAPDKG
jgi:hypothetical protein